MSYTAAPLPTGMTIDANTGEIRWTPTIDQVGQYPLTVTVRDANNAVSTQGFLLDVAENRPPQITSQPVTTVTAGAIYRYSIRATDPENGPLTYSLAQSPDGMTIDQYGRILWQSAVGTTAPQAVTVTVTDNRGQTATQAFEIAVVADTQAPNVSITVQLNDQFYTGDTRIDVGSVYVVQVFATDNVAVADVALLVNGTRVALDRTGSITLTANALGAVQLQATGKDTTGLEGSSSATVTIVDPSQPNQPVVTDPTLPPHPGFDPTDNRAPIVTITSPAPASKVTNLTPIIGTVDDPEDNLWYYRVYYARVDRVSISQIDLKDTDWVVLKQSTQEVIDGELAVFDPSVLTNDPYAVIVAAFDGNGRGYVQPTVLYVEGNVQVGNFRLEFTDLSIPLAEIRIWKQRSPIEKATSRTASMTLAAI